MPLKGVLRNFVKLSVKLHHLNLEAERRCGLSLVQWHVLHCLRDIPGVSAYGLAKAAGLHPSTITQALRGMGRKGHVFVGEDPRDSRRKCIALTRAGAAALDDAQAKLEDWLSGSSAAGGGDAAESLTALLAACVTPDAGQKGHIRT